MQVALVAARAWEARVAKSLAQRIADNATCQRIAWFFLKPFYPAASGFNPFEILVTVFVPQKVFRINGRIPWPVFPSARVLHWQNIKIGRSCAPGFSQGCYIQARNGIVIGDNFRIGPNVGLISANHDPDDFDRRVPSPPIVIGANVWIGMNAIVLPGVQIGDNVIVGAGSVVTHNLPSNVVAAGNPCRVLREKPPYGGGSGDALRSAAL